MALTGETMGAVFDFPVGQFFNLLSAKVFIDKKEEEKIRRWRAQH